MTLNLSRNTHERHIHDALKDAAHARDMVYNLWTHDLRQGPVKGLKAVYTTIEAGVEFRLAGHSISSTLVCSLFFLSSFMISYVNDIVVDFVLIVSKSEKDFAKLFTNLATGDVGVSTNCYPERNS